MSLHTTGISRIERKIKRIIQDALATLDQSKADKRNTSLLPNEELEALWAFAVQGWSRQVSRWEAESTKAIIAAHRK